MEENKQVQQFDKLYTALADAQKDIKPPVKDRVGNYKNKYSSLDAVYESCRIPLSKHGLTIQEDVENVEGKYWLITTLSHKSGQCKSYKMPVIVQQVTCHSFVSGLTYARRAAVTSLLGLPQDDDDDGNQAMIKKEEPKATISEAQYKELMKYLDNLPYYKKVVSDGLKNGQKVPLEKMPLSMYSVILKSAMQKCEEASNETGN